MIKTNLLPYRAARKKENIRRQLSVSVLFFIFVAAALAFYHIHLSSKLSTLREGLAFKENELKGYQAKVQEADQIRDQLDVLNKKLSVMDQLKQNRMEMVNLMNALVALTVKGSMWITNVSHTAPGVNIDGIAIDNKTVAIFMSRIEKSSLFSGALLKDVVQDEKSGLKLKRFTLTCLKKVEPQEQIEASKEKKDEKKDKAGSPKKESAGGKK